MAGARFFSPIQECNAAMSKPLFALSTLLVSGSAIAVDDVTVDVVYVADTWANLSGGIDRGAAYLDNLDLAISVDSKALGLKNGTFFAYGLYNNNATLSDQLTGDAQVISNIDAERHFRLEEFWYEQRFADGRGSVKAGLIDLNSEFDAKDTSALFINSSHGIGPDFSQAGENGPSIFPSTSLAVRFDWAPNDNTVLRVGAFDAVPNDPANQKKMKLSWSEGTLLVGEVNHTLASGWRLGLGGWAFTSKFTPILSAATDKVGGNNGLYAFAEGPVLRPAGNSDRGMDAFLRIGVADSSFNQFQSYWSGGVVFRGIWAARPDDRLGVAVAYARNGDDFKTQARLDADHVKTGEINIEVTYSTQVNDWLAIQPNLQYVINPGGLGNFSNALAAGVRLEFAAGF